MPEPSNVQKVYGHIGHRSAVTRNGQLYVWGRNERGELGLGDASGRPKPVRTTHINNVERLFTVYLDGGGTQIYAATHTGELYVWGDGLRASRYERTPLRVPGVPGATQVTNLYGDIVAVGTDGTLHRWDRSRPSTAAPLAEPVGVTQLTYMSKIWYAVDKEGNVWAWGENAHNVLGIDSTEPVRTPTRITELSNVVRLNPGHGAVHAVCSDGSVWAWGNNDYGLLGLGDTHRHERPERIQGLPPIRDLWGSSEVRYAIDAAGNVYSWGWGMFGRHGHGDEHDRHRPEQIQGLPAISHMDFLTITSASAITPDGQVWAWGSNGADLGLGKIDGRQLKPKLVPGLTGVVETHWHLSMRWALTSAGHIYMWGT